MRLLFMTRIASLCRAYPFGLPTCLPLQSNMWTTVLTSGVSVNQKLTVVLYILLSAIATHFGKCKPNANAKKGFNLCQLGKKGLERSERLGKECAGNRIGLSPSPATQQPSNPRQAQTKPRANPGQTGNQLKKC